MAGRHDRRYAAPGGGARRVAAALVRQPQRGVQAVRGAVRRQAARRENRLSPGDAANCRQYFATRPLIPVEGAKRDQPVRSAAGSGSGCAGFAERAARPDPQAVADRCSATAWIDLLLMAGEILHEEELAIWMQFNPRCGPGARLAAAEAARRRREQGTQQWPSIVSQSQVPRVRRSGA